MAKRAYLRLALLTTTAVIAAFALVEFIVLYQIVEVPGGWRLGMDYIFYRDLGEQWLANGSFYLPHQLAGPYDVTLMQDVLYPPTALFLFVPLVFLPALAWWALPVAILAYAGYRWRPALWVWPLILLLAMWPRTMSAFLYGNTDMWMAVAVAGGLLWGWPALLVVIKPTFAPLALLGIRRRSWWGAAAVIALVSLPMLALWADYVTSIRNLHISLDYSLGSLPLMFIPLMAWLGRRSPEAGTR